MSYFKSFCDAYRFSVVSLLQKCAEVSKLNPWRYPFESGTFTV